MARMQIPFLTFFQTDCGLMGWRKGGRIEKVTRTLLTNWQLSQSLAVNRENFSDGQDSYGCIATAEVTSLIWIDQVTMEYIAIYCTAFIKYYYLITFTTHISSWPYFSHLNFLVRKRKIKIVFNLLCFHHIF